MPVTGETLWSAERRSCWQGQGVAGCQSLAKLMDPRPPSKPRRAAAVTARATTLADRLDHYTAERDAFDRLRNQREELEEEPTASEVLEQVKRDFQRVLTAARVNVAELFTQFGTACVSRPLVRSC